MQISSSIWGRATALHASRAEVTMSSLLFDVKNCINKVMSFILLLCVSYSLNTA